MRTNHMRRMTFTIAAGAALCLLAGCATSTAADPSAGPTATPAVTPTPTEMPEADPADPATWIISDEGIGPVELGGDFGTVLGMLPDTWKNDEVCSWTAWWTAADSSYGVYFVRGTESDTAPISELSVYSAAEDLGTVEGPRTAEGLGVGASTEDVLTTYPDAEQGADEIGSGTWMRLPGDAEGHVFFQFREGEDTASSVTVTSRDAPSYEVCG
ncbi:hypothetical protein ABS642_05580 [Microbacterium sp. A8/3-1]|uniref:Lipoprotein n=1 Tax=Microbacterium sp. A8/3-1 TaxID=3160749 RepID=A0AAU7VZ26_9MICO